MRPVRHLSRPCRPTPRVGLAKILPDLMTYFAPRVRCSAVDLTCTRVYTHTTIVSPTCSRLNKRVTHIFKRITHIFIHTTYTVDRTTVIVIGRPPPRFPDRRRLIIIGLGPLPGSDATVFLARENKREQNARKTSPLSPGATYFPVVYLCAALHKIPRCQTASDPYDRQRCRAVL